MFKRRLIHGAAAAIAACIAGKSFIANVLKCKVRLKTKFKCVCVTMCSIVMSPYSCGFIKTE